MKNRENVIIKMLVSVAGLYEGEEIIRPLKTVKHLVNTGQAKIIPAFTGEKIVKKEAVKPKLKMSELGERCIPCEQKQGEIENKKTKEDDNRVQKGTGKQTGTKKGSKK